MFMEAILFSLVGDRKTANFPQIFLFSPVGCFIYYTLRLNYSKHIIDRKGWATMTTKGNAPEGRWKHSCCQVGIHMFVFGGITDHGVCNDLYSLNLLSFTWTKHEELANSPSARFDALFICMFIVRFDSWLKINLLCSL